MVRSSALSLQSQGDSIMEMRHQKLSRGLAEGGAASAALAGSGSRAFRPAFTTGALFSTRTWKGDGLGCAGTAASALACAGAGAVVGFTGAAGFEAIAGDLVSGVLVCGRDLALGTVLVWGSAVGAEGVLVAG